MEAHELGPRLEGCHTDYRITVETEQRVNRQQVEAHELGPQLEGCDIE